MGTVAITHVTGEDMEAHRSPVASRDPVAWTGRGRDADPGGWTPEHTGQNVTCLLRIQTLRITGRLRGVSALHSGHRRRPFYLFIFGVQYRFPPLRVCEAVGVGGGRVQSGEKRLLWIVC